MTQYCEAVPAYLDVLTEHIERDVARALDSRRVAVTCRYVRRVRVATATGRAAAVAVARSPRNCLRITMVRPDHLAAEHLGSRVLGLCVRRPRLSWWLPPGAGCAGRPTRSSSTTAGGRVESAQRPRARGRSSRCASRQRGRRGGCGSGPTRASRTWSDAGWFEAGLLEPADWTARWIEPDEPERPPPGERPAYVLRHDVRRSTTPTRRPACTPPRTASTRRSSTAAGSATSS